ncbi:MAG: hypothetical protein VCA34_04330 [Roseibacillus sp.]
MRGIPIAEEGFVLPVAGFHLGVELGQVAVLGAAILLALPFLWKGAFARMRVPGSVAIASVGLFRTFQHLFQKTVR